MILELELASVSAKMRRRQAFEDQTAADVEMRLDGGKGLPGALGAYKLPVHSDMASGSAVRCKGTGSVSGL